MTNLPPKVQRRRDELAKKLHAVEYRGDPPDYYEGVFMAGFNAAYTEYVEPFLKTLRYYADRDNWFYVTGSSSKETLFRAIDRMDIENGRTGGLRARNTLAKLGLDDGGKDD